MLKSFLSCNFFVLLYKQRLSFLFVTPKKIPLLENYENGNLIYRSVKVWGRRTDVVPLHDEDIIGGRQSAPVKDWISKYSILVNKQNGEVHRASP